MSNSELVELFRLVASKLESPIFNGGFETLVQNVERIETTQQTTNRKLDEIHSVIYEPDEGIFARVKQVESTHREGLEPLKRDVATLLEWREQLHEKEGFVEQVREDHHTVQQLMTWKNRLIGVALSGLGATTLILAKFVYELVRDHVVLH